MSNYNSESLFDFKFYELENRLKDEPFLRQPFGDSWEEYSYGEVGIQARKLATGLKSLGLKKNAHIGLISKNCREWVIADLAIMMAGYISVPFFANLTYKELSNLLDFGDVDLLIVGKIEDWENQKKGSQKKCL
jgi:long-subunit acyl-CoA synthetase (AMP-forming)